MAQEKQALILLGVFALSACSAREPPKEVMLEQEQTYYTRRGTVGEVTLKDGTRCVTFRDGITCEWKQ